jgi:putative nucleotidyltransferase with HDIG domain
MNREDALALVHDWTKNPNLVKHMLAVEAEMRALAKHFKEDEDLWGIAGLLHDADYEMFSEDKESHPSKIFEELKKRDADPQIAEAIKAHAWGWGDNVKNQNKEPQSKMEWAIYTCDDLSGLIIACALVQPEKKLSNVTVKSILNKWRDKGFAKGVHRDTIELCQEKLGIELPEYLDICLKAVQSISSALGL